MIASLLSVLVSIAPAVLPDPGPALATPPLATGWKDGIPSGGWPYLYGGTTEGATVEGPNGRRILAYRGDDREYSGWTVHLPKLVDLSAVRKTGGLRIRFRGAQGGEKVVLGIMDDEADGPGRKAQTRVALADFGKPTTEWQTVVVPLGSFEDQGYWWDDARHTEIAVAMDWSRIAELRISSEQSANAKVAGPDHRFELQVAELQLVAEGPVVWDAAAHWKAFRSDAPDRSLWRWDSLERAVWTTGADVASRMEAHLDSADGARFLRLDYQMTKWANAGAAPKVSDWSHHAGLAVRLRSKHAASVVQFALLDSTGEQWIASSALKAGWNDILVPFSDFGRNPWYQPDGAGGDRRLDLGAVRWFQVQPQENGIPGRLDLASIALTNRRPEPAPVGPEPTRILSNLVGWTPGGVKRFLVAGAAGADFAILDTAGKAVFVAPLTPLGRSELSGQDLSVGDFTRFARAGTWRLSVDTLRTAPFRIAPDVRATPFRESLRAFYYLRASTDLPASFAGPWARKAGHPDTALEYLEVGDARKGRGSATGGWYDAGDYGKYVVNGGISVATLLELQDLLPKAVPDGALGIPESGNGVGDLLDEVRWELAWFLRMQDRDGGVFFKIAGTSWSPMVMPDQDDMPRFLIGKSTASTLNFAAATAQAARLWKKVDPAFAKTCLAAAEKAWAWAKAHPSVLAPSEHGGSGGYSDSQFDDEFLWAAAELWLATGRKPYRTEIVNLLPKLPLLESADWARTQNPALYSLALRGGKDSLASVARARLDTVATALKASLESNPLRIPVEGFRWGSNGDLANRGVLLAFHHAVTGDSTDLDALTEIVDYLHGRNPMGTSYVTGQGSPAARDPHLRFSVGDTVELPPPGFLSGGPNSGRQDDASKNPGGVKYAHTEPARCWIDDHRSYASNEIAINWNAPLALVLGYLDAHRR